MRNFYFVFLFIFSTFSVSAQSLATFEGFDLPLDTFLNGSDGSGGFSDGIVFLPNDYNADWDSWSGWAISSKTDSMTPGYDNQFSAITGVGVDNSVSYATAFASPESLIKLNNDTAQHIVNGLFITNSTYAYLSMLEGDSFSKKFGGETGDDPDFFLLTIRKYLNGELLEDGIEFYLADFRFEDNSEDYIINDWTFLDLSALGKLDSLSFSLSSSDNGDYGMNTPAYFCIDNLALSEVISTSNINTPLTSGLLNVYPNPAVDRISLELPDTKSVIDLRIFDTLGRQVLYKNTNELQNSIDISSLDAGTYFLQIRTANQKQFSTIFIKN